MDILNNDVGFVFSYNQKNREFIITASLFIILHITIPHKIQVSSNITIGAEVLILLIPLSLVVTRVILGLLDARVQLSIEIS